jgi:hypothetical protein
MINTIVCEEHCIDFSLHKSEGINTSTMPVLSNLQGFRF